MHTPNTQATLPGSEEIQEKPWSGSLLIIYILSIYHIFTSTFRQLLSLKLALINLKERARECPCHQAYKLKSLPNDISIEQSSGLI